MHGGDACDGISVLIRKRPELRLPPQEDTGSRGPSASHDENSLQGLRGHLDRGLLASRTLRSECLLSSCPGIWFPQPECLFVFYLTLDAWLVPASVLSDRSQFPRGRI